MKRMHAHPIEDDRRRERRVLVIQSAAGLWLLFLIVVFAPIYFAPVVHAAP